MFSKDKRVNSVGRYFYSSTTSSCLLPYQNTPISLFQLLKQYLHESSLILSIFPYWITKDCGHALVIQTQKLFVCYHVKFHSNTTHISCVNYSTVNANMPVYVRPITDNTCEVARVLRKFISEIKIFKNWLLFLDLCIYFLL